MRKLGGVNILATFHGWKDVDLIVRSNEIEVDEDNLGAFVIIQL